MPKVIDVFLKADVKLGLGADKQFVTALLTSVQQGKWREPRTTSLAHPRTHSRTHPHHAIRDYRFALYMCSLLFKLCVYA